MPILIDMTPIIIGHRGASGHRPENTIASYDKAIEFGVDYIEIDVVSTKDHVLVGSHDPVISHTTDVDQHPEFAPRYVTKQISGVAHTGYFSDDFTIKEIKSLRTKERFEFRDHSWDFIYPMPTLQEVITFVKAKEVELNRKIGIYIETKHPHYYRSVGLPLDELLVKMLHENGYTSQNDHIWIESFESNLKHLRTMTNLSLIQLVSGTEGDSKQYDTKRPWTEITSVEGLREIATYAQGVAPHKSCIFVRQNLISNQPIKTSFIEDAHAAGLAIHVWTFRKERERFEKHEKQLFDSIENEMIAFFKAGVDGIFADQPDIAISVRNDMFSQKEFLMEHLSSIKYIIAIGVVFSIGIIWKSKSRNHKKLKINKTFAEASPKYSRSNEN